MYCEYATMPAFFGIAIGASELCGEEATCRCLFVPSDFRKEDDRKLRILYYCTFHGKYNPFQPYGFIENLV